MKPDIAGSGIGAPLKRREDDRLLRGHGQYLDDLSLPGMAEIAFLRSSVASARITRIDTSRAKALPGVVDVITWDDIRDEVDPLVLEAEMRIPAEVAEAIKPLVRVHPLPLLADGSVSSVGQPIAAVVAVDRYVAEDALELITVEYDEVPAIVAPLDALDDDSRTVVPSDPDNVAISVEGRHGDAEAAFAAAAYVVEAEYESHRYVASPMETRGVLAHESPTGDQLTVYASTQTPHRLREVIASCLRRDLDSIRVTAPDVGGGFGQKGIQYVEDILVPYLALRTGRPVKWSEDRIENLSAASHAREQLHRIKLAADKDGRFVALADDIIINLGSANVTGLVVPYNSLTHVIGPYRIPTLDLRVRGVLTNTMFTTPYRGAGRPESVFAMERSIDRLAHEMGITPSELRRRNVIQPDEMPYQTGLMYRDGTMQTYDSGQFPELLERVTSLVERARTEREAESRPTTTRLGSGLAMYIEGTGLGPFESASVSVYPSGRVVVATGAASQGQAHATTFAQVAADSLGVDIDRIEIKGGDTAAVRHGVGTMASRSMVTAGNAIHLACQQMRATLCAAGAAVLEVASDKVTLTDGAVHLIADPGTRIDIAELAARRAPLLVPTSSSGSGSVIVETAYFRPKTVTVASAAHGAVVEVDELTGKVRLLDYVVVHDCGRVVNPMVADGQVTGGVMQGIGGALYEEMQYDEIGQPRTVTYMDYLVPTSAESPRFILDHVETHSDLNPLGVKGLGEGGAIAPGPTIANAVEDALGADRVHITRGPLTPSRIRELIRTDTPGRSS